MSDYQKSFDVALSYASEDRDFVDRVAECLKAKNIRVFYDKDEEIDLWGKELPETLDSIFRTRSDFVVLFISKHYASKMWTNYERQSAFARAIREDREYILPARFDDTELKGLRPTVRAIHLRHETPESFAAKIIQKLDLIRGAGSSNTSPLQTPASVSDVQPLDSPHNQFSNRPLAKPSRLRNKFDRWFPYLHKLLTRRLRFLSEPPESRVLRAFLSNQSREIWEEIRSKTYIEPQIKNASENPGIFKTRRTGLRNQSIKEILGLSQGGDAHSAQVSALSRKSRFVRNMVKRVLTTQEPLMLLGDPGMGKSLTLLQAAMLIAERESSRIFPRVCLFVPLGGLRIGANKNTAVWDYVIDSTPPELRPYLEDLANNKRLIILFDGMDEMSRVHYNEYTTALSDFAKDWKDRIKTLFSCRITDFTPAFRHNRLVLLPFTEKRVRQYLESQSILVPPIKIADEYFYPKGLAKKITDGELTVQATNPFVLWLLCKYILKTKQWPRSRVELLDHYNRSNYEEQMSSGLRADEWTQAMESAFLAWGKIALEITNRNLGTELFLSDVEKLLGPDEFSKLHEGLRCGVFWQDQAATVIRFKHHRFQEFFTAYYLHNSKDVVSLRWLDKLDSPRWQETMFNLVLMGGGDEALLALSESFDQDVTNLAELNQPVAEVAESGESQPVTADVDEPERRAKISNLETLLADRVELASRILQQTQHHQNKTRSTLLSAFERAVYLLSDHGNPITHVKLLLASRIVPEIDLWGVFDKAVALNVNWVSQQAHIIALAANQKRKVNTPDQANALHRLLSDLWLNFASGQFLNRLGYYLGIATSGQYRLRLVLAAGLFIYLAAFAAGYGLVLTARQVLLPAFSLTETWAQRSLHKGVDFWEKKAVEGVKAESEKRNAQPSETRAALKEATAWPRWLRSHFEAGRPRFEIVVASSARTLNSWWFFGIIHAVMLLGLIYSLKISPGYSLLAFQTGGYLSLLLTITLWTIWLGGVFNIILLVYFLVLFAAVLSSIAWIVMCLVGLVGVALFSVITLVLTRQSLARARPSNLPLQPFWDSGIRRAGGRIFELLTIAFLLSLLIPISIGVEVDWRLALQRLDQLIAQIPSVPLGIKISLNVLIFSVICVVILRQMPRVKARIAQRLKRVDLGSTVGETFFGCLFWIVIILGCSALSGLSKINWPFVGQYALQTFGLFPSLTLAVNISFSVITYAIVAGCLVSLVAILVKRLRNTKKILQGLVGWLSFWLTVALLVLGVWGVFKIYLNSRIYLSAIWTFIIATFNLFPYFPPLVNGFLSLAFYLEVIGCLVSLGLVLRKKDEGLQRPLRDLGKWTIFCLIIALVPFVFWGIVLLLAKLGVGFYSAAVTGQLGPIIVVILGIACIVALGIVLSQVVKDTPFDPTYVLRRPADPTDEWKYFQNLSPKRQAMLITRTSDSNRSDEDFLTLLYSVEKTVAEEPASSVYWETRGRLEAIALQKRMG